MQMVPKEPSGSCSSLSKKSALCRERGARALEERLAVAQKAAAEAEDGKPSLPVSSKPPSTSSGKQPPLKEKAPADEAV